jgi:hypothetical protein
MAKYANVTCSKCDKVLLGNKMHRVKDHVTTRSQNSIRNKGGSWTDNSRREYSNTKERRLCSSCYFNRLILRYGILGGIAAAIYFGGPGNFSQTDSGHVRRDGFKQVQEIDISDAAPTAQQEPVLLNSGNFSSNSPTSRASKSKLLSGMIAAEDYPDLARENGDEGISTASFTVGIDGKANSCSASGATNDLNERTCEIIENRFQFKPAIDAEGNQIEESRVQKVAWKLEE